MMGLRFSYVHSALRFSPSVTAGERWGVGWGGCCLQAAPMFGVDALDYSESMHSITRSKARSYEVHLLHTERKNYNSLQLYVHIQSVVRDLHIKALRGLQELQLGVLRVVFYFIGDADEQCPHRLESAAHVEGFPDGEVCVVGPRLVQRV